jgi:hypothetical protein
VLLTNDGSFKKNLTDPKRPVADLCDKTLSKLFNSGTTNTVSSSRPLTERERQGIYVMCGWHGLVRGAGGRGSMFLAPEQLQQAAAGLRLQCC